MAVIGVRRQELGVRRQEKTKLIFHNPFRDSILVESGVRRQESGVRNQESGIVRAVHVVRG